MTKRTGKAASALFDNAVLVGTITILVVAVAVYLSYIAENGLPFVPTYNVNVDVTNASELVKNADVRIGGARVGQVLTITPEPPTKSWPHPYARLGLALERSLDPLPSDSHYRIRLASVLGGKYLELIPGTSKRGGLQDGGTFTLSTNPRLDHNLPFVDLDTAFATFGPKTRRGFRGVIGQFGDAIAGRGPQMNDAIYSLHRLMPALENVLRLFAAPSTRLSEFVSGLAGTTGALAPVARTLTSLLLDAGTTFRALDIQALGATIDQLPGTESVATSVLTNSRPVLADAATIVGDLKPGAALLPTAAQRLELILRGATPVFRLVPGLASGLGSASVAIEALAGDPAATQTFKVLGSTDLATFGSSAFEGLGAILRAVAPAQFACNTAGLWVRNFASSLSEGDNTGGWLRFAPIIDFNGGSSSQSFEQSTPSPDLHLNPYPTENSSQCQAGNETYTGAQRIGSPPRTSTTVDNTQPPPGVLQEGKKAGLVP
jgi:virulence factor Mce-like protein